MPYRALSCLLCLLLLVSACTVPSAAEPAEDALVEVFVCLTGEGLADAAAAVGGAAAYAATPAGAAAIAAAEEELDALAAAAEAIDGAEVLGRSWYLTRSIGVRLPAGRLDELSALEGVAAVELLGVISPMDTADSAEESQDASSDPADTAAQPGPLYAPDLLGLDARHTAGQLGQGALVAVIDTGFDVSHPVFTLPEGTAPALTEEKLQALWPTLSIARANRVSDPARLWVSEKIPFAFDYYDKDTGVQTLSVHGTHVASILAGGADAAGDYVGIAPAAQLLLMKVFSDGSEPTASEYALYSAIEDAVLLGADVISLSLGSAPGYTYATNTFSIYRHLEKARELGCTVVCAVGNDGAVGRGSAYDTAREINFPLAANPDYGMVAEPASYALSLAVGAYMPEQVLERGLGAGDGSLFAYTDSAAGQGFTDRRFTEVLAEQTLPYVVVPGLGAAADYDGLSLEGKLALVRRGEITFTEKLAAAAAAGAVGMICYNNVPGDDVFSMAFDAMPIPAVSVTEAVGQALADAAEKTVTVSASLLRITAPVGAGMPTDYSSRSSGLSIRPSLLSPGTVYAAAPGGEYLSQSGTSMATPLIAGLCALAVADLPAGADRDDALTARLITTAVPMLDEAGHPFPVRVQGGGRVQPEAFFAAESLLRAEDGGAVIELGDGLPDRGAFTLRFTLENPTAKPQTYTLSASVGSDDYFLLEDERGTVAFAANRAHVFADAELVLGGVNINRYGEGNVSTVQLAPGERRSFAVEVTLSEAEAAEYRRYFSNGYYLEGYIWAERADGECLSIPYLGFAGDFDALPYLDEFSYDGGTSFFGDNYLLGTTLSGKVLRLGCNFYDENTAFRRDLIAFSPNQDGMLDEASGTLHLLRSLYSFEATVTDENGEVINRTQRGYYLKKTHYDEKDESLDGMVVRLWNGETSDGVGYVVPDGRYTVTYRIFGMGDAVLEEYSLPIVVDTRPPEVTDIEVYTTEDGGRRVAITLRDEHYPMRAVLYRDATDSYGRVTSLYRDDHNISYREGRRALTLIYDISSFAGDYLYLDVYDYALNQKTYRIALD